MKLPRPVQWVLWAFFIFLIYSIFRSPEDAASLVVGGFEGIGRGFAAIFTFFDAVLTRMGSSDGAQSLTTLSILV